MITLESMILTMASEAIVRLWISDARVKRAALIDRLELLAARASILVSTGIHGKVIGTIHPTRLHLVCLVRVYETQ